MKKTLVLFLTLLVLLSGCREPAAPNIANIAALIQETPYYKIECVAAQINEHSNLGQYSLLEKARANIGINETFMGETPSGELTVSGLYMAFPYGTSEQRLCCLWVSQAPYHVLGVQAGDDVKTAEAAFAPYGFVPADFGSWVAPEEYPGYWPFVRNDGTEINIVVDTDDSGKIFSISVDARDPAGLLTCTG